MRARRGPVTDSQTAGSSTLQLPINCSLLYRSVFMRGIVWARGILQLPADICASMRTSWTSNHRLGSSPLEQPSVDATERARASMEALFPALHRVVIQPDVLAANAAPLLFDHPAGQRFHRPTPAASAGASDDQHRNGVHQGIGQARLRADLAPNSEGDHGSCHRRRERTVRPRRRPTVGSVRSPVAPGQPFPRSGKASSGCPPVRHASERSRSD